MQVRTCLAPIRRLRDCGVSRILLHMTRRGAPAASVRGVLLLVCVRLGFETCRRVFRPSQWSSVLMSGGGGWYGLSRVAFLCEFELPCFKHASRLLPVPSLFYTRQTVQVHPLALRRRNGGNSAAGGKTKPVLSTLNPGGNKAIIRQKWT